MEFEVRGEEGEGEGLARLMPYINFPPRLLEARTPLPTANSPL